MERDQVNRLLAGQTDRGVLLILGEAGIGKSRLVRAATSDARNDGMLVLVGSCLSMGASIPLLPISDILRDAYGIDNGQWIAAALADCPRYVGESVGLLLPEVREDTAGFAAAETADFDPWWRLRLFSSVRALLGVLGRTRKAALVIEDVHWADTSTLELLDYLLLHGDQVTTPVVLTFRAEDTETPEQSTEWMARAKRCDTVEVLQLDALSHDETAQQIQLLTGHDPTPPMVDAIFARSEGNALFTEQLVGHDDGLPLSAAPALPEDLRQLFDGRLRKVSPEGRSVAQVLAVAGRPLDAERLGELTGLAADDLLRALRDLKRMRLLRTSAEPSLRALRHALLVEAVVADMLPVERAAVHRRLAASLSAAAGTGAAAEVAEHWRGAGSIEEELRWRVQAAHEAEAIYASDEASEHWQRAIQLWDRAAVPRAVAGVDVFDLYAAAEHALEHAGHSDRAGALAEAAFARFAAQASGAEKADLYRRLGYYRGVTSAQQGLDALEQAIKLYEQLPPSPGLLWAYDAVRELLDTLGRHDEAARVTDQALAASEVLNDPGIRGHLLGARAMYDIAEGDPEAGARRIQDAWQIVAAQPDPHGRVYLAVFHTDILLKICAPCADVERAAAPGLRATVDFGLDESFATSTLRGNVAEALIESGDVARAKDLLEPVAAALPNPELRNVSRCLAHLDLLHGDPRSARQRLAEIEALPFNPIESRAAVGVLHAELELWAGDPRSAYDRAVELLSLTAATPHSKYMGGAVVLAARAAAELTERQLGLGSPTATGERIDADTVGELRAAMAEDPLAQPLVPADAAAQLASWEAELARLRGESSPEAWENAASAWDRLNRPHRAAYCQWRQAEVLLGERASRGIATAVLRRAVKGARQHAPLTAALGALAQRARIELQEPSVPPPATARAPQTPFNLTEREVAVLRLIGEGRTNSEIGAALFISRKTASVHVTNILRKLDVSTRVQAAAVAERAGLLATDPSPPNA
jgi:DNA-binding CsgD family transcriptional regulator